MSFQAHVRNSTTQIRVLLKGKFNEEVDLPSLNTKGISNIVFDWGGVTYINSVGVGKWIKYLNDLAAAIEPEKLSFERCPFIIVEQMGKVRDFIKPGMKVTSFAVPFVCDSCGEQKMMLYEDGQHFNISNKTRPNVHPTVVCMKCNDNMVIDVVPQRYFSFFDLIWKD